MRGDGVLVAVEMPVDGEVDEVDGFWRGTRAIGGWGRWASVMLMRWRFRCCGVQRKKLVSCAPIGPVVASYIYP